MVLRHDRFGSDNKVRILWRRMLGAVIWQMNAMNNRSRPARSPYLLSTDLKLAFNYHQKSSKNKLYVHDYNSKMIRVFWCLYLLVKVLSSLGGGETTRLGEEVAKEFSSRFSITGMENPRTLDTSPRGH